MARFAGAIDERTQDFEGSAIAYVSTQPPQYSISPTLFGTDSPAI
jgi:hypothetical protein